MLKMGLYATKNTINPNMWPIVFVLLKDVRMFDIKILG